MNTRRGGGRAWRRVGWVALGLVVLLVAAVLSVPLWLRPLVERQASAALGRPVTIGRLHVAPENPLVVTAEDVTLGNPPGFRDAAPLARIPRLTARIEPGPLLRGDLVVPDLALERPVLSLVQTAERRDNFTFDLGEGDGGPRVGALHIREGRARLALAPLATEMDLAVETQDAPPGGEPTILVRGEGSYAGERIAGELTGGALLDLRDAATPWPVEVALQSGRSALRIKGTLRDPLRLRGAEVGVLVSGADLRELEPLTGVPLPPTPPYELGGKLDFAEGAWRVSDMAGNLGRSDVAGALALATRGERPELTTELRSERVDLRDLAGFLGGTPVRPDTPGATPEQRARAAQAQAEPRLLPDTPVDLPRFTAVDVHVDYRAARILGREVPLDNLALRFDLVNGQARISPLSLGVGRGRIAAEIALDPQDGALRARADVRFERVDLARLMQDTGFAGSGTLSGWAQVEGTGRSTAEILGNGNGALVLTMAGGDLSKLLVDLSGLRFGSALLAAMKMPERTRVQCFVADLALRRGVLNSRALLLETEDTVTEGEGTVSLARETLEIRIRTESKNLTVAAVPTPLLIRGTLKNPTVVPEPGELIARGGIAGALAAIAPPLAALPTIQFGIGDDPRCEGLLGRARRGGATTGGEPRRAPARGGGGR